MAFQLNFRVKNTVIIGQEETYKQEMRNPLMLQSTLLYNIMSRTKKAEQQMNSFNLHFHYNFLSNDFFMHE